MRMNNIEIPKLNEKIYSNIENNWLNMKKPAHSLGKIEKIISQYGAMINKEPTEELKSAMILTCGDHGFAKYGVSAYPPEVTVQMIKGYIKGTAAATVLANHCNADVFISDIGVNADLSDLAKVHNLKVTYGTNDFTVGPAMTKKQAIDGIKSGMKIANMCMDKGYNMLITGEMGIGNTTSTAAIASAAFDLEPEKTVGRGSGINDERMKIKRDVVSKGLKVNKPDKNDGLDILAKVGGYDHAGLVGAIIAGAMRRVPTMVDGVNATAAALLAYKIYPESANYMLCSHLSEEISHKKMLEEMNLKPIVDAGMCLGEGTGASLAIVIMQAGLNVYNKLKNDVDSL